MDAKLVNIHGLKGPLPSPGFRDGVSLFVTHRLQGSGSSAGTERKMCRKALVWAQQSCLSLLLRVLLAGIHGDMPGYSKEEAMFSWSQEQEETWGWRDGSLGKMLAV